MKISRININSTQTQKPKYQDPKNLRTTAPTPERTTNLSVISFCAAGLNNVKNFNFNNNSCFNAKDELFYVPEGYNKEKDYIYTNLTQPLLQVNNSAQTPVSPFFVVHVTDKKLKTNIKNRLVEDLSANCNIIEPDGKITPENFGTKLPEILKQSKTNYLKTGKRSVLVLDNLENYISKNNYQNVMYIKSIADYCSRIPLKSSDDNAALTILSFSDNPLLIDEEIIYRPEKTYSVAFAPMQSREIQSVLKKEVTKQEKFLSSLKDMSEFDLKFANLPFPAWKTLQTLKVNGKMSGLTTGFDYIPFETLAFFAAPNEQLGAFSYEQLQNIVKNTGFKYLENPQNKFSSILAQQIANTKREISPEKLRKEIDLKNSIEFKKKKSEEEITRINSLLKVMKLGLATKEQKTELAQSLFDKKVRRICLETKKETSDLTVDETKELDALKTLQTKEQNTVNAELKRLKNNVVAERINEIENGRYKFSYGDNEDDYVNLYLASFGHDKSTLWIDSDEVRKIEIVSGFFDEIKNKYPFISIQHAEFPLEPKYGKKYIDTGRITLDNKPIYKINM